MKKKSSKKVHLIILAAGYATRLYPLTLTRPKPLLEVAGKPILEHILGHFGSTKGLEKIHVITNEKFAAHFDDWSEKYPNESHKNLFNFINDGSRNETDKLGAVGDLHLALEQEGIDEDIIVVAGDNIFSESLDGFEKFAREKQAPVLGVYDVGDLEAIKKFNSITIDPDQRITFFEEKPKNPTSTTTGICLYYYPKDTIPLIKQYVRDGNNTDQPGHLVQWLYSRVPFYTWNVPGIWYDVGSKETLEEAERVFSTRNKKTTFRKKKPQIASVR